MLKEVYLLVYAFFYGKNLFKTGLELNQTPRVFIQLPYNQQVIVKLLQNGAKPCLSKLLF